MKKIWKFLTLILILGIYSCQDEAGEIANGLDPFESESTESLITTETSAESLYEDVDLAVDESVDFAFSSEQSAGGRVEHQRRRPWRSKHFGDCVEVEHDTVEQVIIIDFGDGCEGRNGVIRSGKIIITYDGDRKTVGSWKSVTFEDFFVDSTQVEGVITHTIQAIDDLGNKTILSTLEGGKLTFPDGTTATRDHEFTKFRFKGETVEDSYATVDGFAEGTNKAGVAYTMNIDETLLWEGSCFLGGYGYIPVAGIKTIVKGEDELIIDFGDGDCDNLVTVTINGESKVIELTRRGRKVVRG